MSGISIQEVRVLHPKFPTPTPFLRQRSSTSWRVSPLDAAQSILAIISYFDTQLSQYSCPGPSGFLHDQTFLECRVFAGRTSHHVAKNIPLPGHGCVSPFSGVDVFE